MPKVKAIVKTKAAPGKTETAEGAVSPATAGRLRWTNIGFGIFHLLQGTIILLLGSGFQAKITASYYASSSQWFYEPRILIAAFLYITALDHLLLAAPRLFPWYTRNLGRRINYARWFEYSVSASIMIVIIASLSGMTDFVSLLSLFFLTTAMNLFGLMMELHNQATEKTSWWSFILGSVIGIIPWVGIILYFINAGANIPAFVYALIIVLIIFFSLFPINMWLQYAGKGKWRSYIFGEWGYMFLSITAKTCLAWIVFGGTLNSPVIYR
jgi:hypothetical protein